jgi:hypothetical protein
VERVLSGGAPVGVPAQFDKGNERAFRQYVDGEFALVYRKGQNVIIPFGSLLGFYGSTGKTVTFGLDGSDAFTISIDDAAAITLATSGDLSELEASITVDVAEIDDKLVGSFGFSLDVNNRIASLKLLSDGTTSDIVFKADSFKFFDGVSDVALFSAAAGLVTINGDLAVSGSIRVGAVRWPVALQPAQIYAADGDAIQWANGSALSAVPIYEITIPSGVALAAGEAWDPPTIQSATTTGGTLRLKISTPGATSGVTDNTDAAGGVGDPDRVMDKADSADAYDGIYRFRIQGTITILSENNGDGTFYHDGEVVLSSWFDDGGGWDEGPAIRISALDALGFDTSGSSLTGSQSFDVTKAVTWANAIGQHGGTEYGVSIESGGSLTDFVSVNYTKQAVSGTRTGSPNGETATILYLPQNA